MELFKPLADITIPDRTPANVTQMEKYAEIFFYLEFPILMYWKDHPHLKDKTVISTFKQLIKQFDNDTDSLAGIISRAVRVELMRLNQEGKTFTYGEVISCVRLLKKIAKTHKSPNGRGYLHWVETFFRGQLPETDKEMKAYIQQYESWF